MLVQYDTIRNFVIKMLIINIFITSISCVKNNDIILKIPPPNITSINYVDVREDVFLIKDVIYAEGMTHKNGEGETMSLKMDIYQPKRGSENRPLFIFVHGGGFITGSKQDLNISRWGNYYASKGFVFMSVDYRLRDDLGTIPKEWYDYPLSVPEANPSQLRAIYPSQRDVNAAVRWALKNASAYKINTNYITIGGSSAGASMAISAAVSKPEEFRDEISIDEDKTLLTTNMHQGYKIKTIIDLWGSKNVIDAIEIIYNRTSFNKESPSLFIAHGDNDNVVSINKALALKEIYESNETPFVYYKLEGHGHGAWGASVDGKSLEELSLDFIIKQQGLIIN
ncbi:MAG: hypothetical protein S4CHLAM20_04330 [Chlamydiia bacterium]|nr:hypothetical protein [Chlamydiia bacterium]